MSLSNQERKIVKKIIQRDEKTLFSLYQKYKKPVLKFIFRQLKDSQLSEEITQDVFLDFLDSLRDFRGDCSLKSFLFSIAKYKVIDAIRKKKLKNIFFSHLPPYFVERLAPIILDDELERKELAKKIKRTFERLPNDYQIVLRLKYIDGEKVIQIAEKLMMNFKAVESLLFRARKAFIKVFKSLP